MRNRKLLKQHDVQLRSGRWLKLDVIEFLEVDPAAYVHEPGYVCEDDDFVEYFVSLTGRVDRKVRGKWEQDVGVCPVLKNEADLFEAAGFYVGKSFDRTNSPVTDP